MLNNKWIVGMAVIVVIFLFAQVALTIWSSVQAARANAAAAAAARANANNGVDPQAGQLPSLAEIEDFVHDTVYGIFDQEAAAAPVDPMSIPA